MPANLTFEALKTAVDKGEIDTVLTVFSDMQGRLTGKRFHARHFVDGGYEETHGCNYLLATDLEMNTVQGYAATSWAAGYGDYVHKPDLSTLRLIPWLPGTALVMCDVLDHHSYEDVPHSPRAILKRQIARAKALGYDAFMATELEFYLFAGSYDTLFDRGYTGLQPLSRYNIDYSILGTTKEEGVMRAIRNGLYGAGIPIENSKGEAEAGQEEINVKYSDALDTADMHVIVKNGVKEIAHAHGISATFMAKYMTGKSGSSSHIHQSFWQNGTPVFLDKDAPQGMSALMRSYVAGLLEHADATTYFLAPYVNSYKRFSASTFAPTKAVWSNDNRTAGYRVCGSGTKGIRIECRVGGADLNPYLAMAGQLAAGLDGIERGLELEPEMKGDTYHTEGLREIPTTLADAAAAMSSSKMLRAAMGDNVIDHYTHAALWEVQECNRSVTDWDVKRGFERS